MTMNMTTFATSKKPSAVQVSVWLNEAHQWNRIADDKRLSRQKLQLARQKVYSLVKQILTYNSNHIPALRLKFHSELSMGQTFAALTTGEQLLSLDTDNQELKMAWARTALVLNRFDQAESAFSGVLALEKDRADAYCGVAMARLGKKDYVGAYLRARSLYTKGYRHADLYRVMEGALTHLKVDEYRKDTENQLLELLQDSHLNPESLSSMLASALRRKYNLDDPDATIDIAQCASDPLLINALLLTSLPDATVESLLGLVRQHVFLNACATGELEESMQTLVIALGIYGQRTEYFGSVSQDELAILDAIQHHVEASIVDGASCEDLVAALLLVSMYRPLYPERYSYKLLRWDLNAWPTRVQSVFKLNLYDYANEHALRHELIQTPQEKEVELTQQTGRTAFPKWSLPELVQEWRQLENALNHLEDCADPHILVLGCGSGKRAVALAQYFPHAEILAVDDNAFDLAYAARQASEVGCDNIEFLFGQWKKQLPMLTSRFDLIECTAFIPNPGKLWCEQLKRLCKENGGIHLRDNALYLPDAIDRSQMQLPHTDGFCDWRSGVLKSNDSQLSLETRHALFNREGAKRLMGPSVQGTRDLAETLQQFGVTPVQSLAEQESSRMSQSTESHSVAI